MNIYKNIFCIVIYLCMKLLIYYLYFKTPYIRLSWNLKNVKYLVLLSRNFSLTVPEEHSFHNLRNGKTLIMRSKFCMHLYQLLEKLYFVEKCRYWNIFGYCICFLLFSQKIPRAFYGFHGNILSLSRNKKVCEILTW